MTKKRLKKNLIMKGSEFTRTALAGGSVALGAAAGVAVTKSGTGIMLGGIGGAVTYDCLMSYLKKRKRR